MPVYSVKGHSAIVNTIDAIGGLGVGGGAPEIVTGSRDGKKSLVSLHLCCFTVGCQLSGVQLPSTLVRVSNYGVPCVSKLM